MSLLSHGQVEIELGGETVTLNPTLAAMEKINRHFGSLREALTRCASLDFTGVVVVIAAGAGLGQEGTKRLPDQVFQAGILNVIGPVSDYLTTLMNPAGQSAGEGSGEGKP